MAAHLYLLTPPRSPPQVSGAYRMLPPDGSEGLSAYGLEYGDICPSPVSTNRNCPQEPFCALDNAHTHTPRPVLSRCRVHHQI